MEILVTNLVTWWSVHQYFASGLNSTMIVESSPWKLQNHLKLNLLQTQNQYMCTWFKEIEQTPCEETCPGRMRQK